MPTDSYGISGLLEGLQQNLQRKDQMKARERQYALQQADLTAQQMRDTWNKQYQQDLLANETKAQEEKARHDKAAEEQAKAETARKEESAKASRELREKLAGDKSLSDQDKLLFSIAAKTTDNPLELLQMVDYFKNKGKGVETIVSNPSTVNSSQGQAGPSSLLAPWMNGTPPNPWQQTPTVGGTPQGNPMVSPTGFDPSQPFGGKQGAEIANLNSQVQSREANLQIKQMLADATKAKTTAEIAFKEAETKLTKEKAQQYRAESEAKIKELLAHADYFEESKKLEIIRGSLIQAQTEGARLTNTLKQQEIDFNHNFGTLVKQRKAGDEAGKILNSWQKNLVSIDAQKQQSRSVIASINAGAVSEPQPPPGTKFAADGSAIPPNPVTNEWNSYIVKHRGWAAYMQQNVPRLQDEQNRLKALDEEEADTKAEVEKWQGIINDQPDGPKVTKPNGVYNPNVKASQGVGGLREAEGKKDSGYVPKLNDETFDSNTGKWKHWDGNKWVDGMVPKKTPQKYQSKPAQKTTTKKTGTDLKNRSTDDLLKDLVK